MFLLRRNKKGFQKYKAAASRLALTRLALFNQHYQAPLRKVFIKNHKSRWGSCSERGNLNFNYKIVFLPPALQDYIIVHELCHLKEFNHSKKFWALVEQKIPQHRKLRSELRRLERGHSKIA